MRFELGSMYNSEVKKLGKGFINVLTSLSATFAINEKI